MLLKHNIRKSNEENSDCGDIKMNALEWVLVHA